MFWVPYNQARTLSVYLPARPDSNPTATLYDPYGGSLSTSITCTIDSPNTTLSGAAALGAQSLGVTSATGITVGRRYLVGGSEADSGETITVKALSGTTVTLVRPITLARASGVAFASSRVEFAIPAQTIISRGYRLEIPWTVSTVAQPPVVVPIDVCRYALTSHLVIEDVRDLDPSLTKRIPPGTWWPGLVEQAWGIIQRRVALTKDPGAMQGTIDLTIAHGYLVRRLLAEASPDEANVKLAETYSVRAQQEMESALAAAKWDADGDGRSEKRDGYALQIKVRRT